MKRIILPFAILLVVVCFFVSNGEEEESKNLTSVCDIKVSGNQSVAKIIDGSQYGSEFYESGTVFEIECEEEIAGIYIIWDRKSPIWMLEVGDNTCTYGEKGFLHEYVEVTNAGKVRIFLSESARICEIYVFGKGVLPDWVQVWNEPHEKADLLLLSTHADDEHLFFAGVLPYYSVERGLKVQVVYMTNHNDTQSRPHELLNGLWVVGIRHYPVISDFPDLAGSLGQKGEDVETVLKRALTLYNEEEVTKFHVENIRRFKPKVIVGHDINGEYGHGAHMVNAHTLIKALELTNDPEYHKESYEKYGLWDVPKTYLHLWKENRIVMDWDVPLSKFDGLTAYEVSKLGYNEHKSQHWTWFTKWFTGVYNGKERNKASDIAEYSPCEYGLYRSTVGEDVLKNDFFENVEPHVDETPVPTTPEPTVSPSLTSTENATPEKTLEATMLPDGVDGNTAMKMIFISAIALALVVAVICLVVRRRRK